MMTPIGPVNVTESAIGTPLGARQRGRASMLSLPGAGCNRSRPQTPRRRAFSGRSLMGTRVELRLARARDLIAPRLGYLLRRGMISLRIRAGEDRQAIAKH